jgi:hypothetical protein
VVLRGLAGGGGGFRRAPAGYARDAALSVLTTRGRLRDRIPAAASREDPNHQSAG